MAKIANTFQTFQAIGIREQLSNIIYNISPTDTPFMSNAGRGDAKNTFFEWQTDSLASAITTNQQIEGDDITAFDAVTPTVRLGNYCQISRKTAIIAGTEEAVDKAGRKSELSYQLAKKSAELKRDMESGLLANVGAAAGSATVARNTGNLLAFIKTNVNKASTGTAGVNPVYTNIPTDVRTDGTVRAFTEVILKDVVQQCWTSGAKIETLMVGAVVKQEISAFAGVATKTYFQDHVGNSKIIGAADIYVSDFGTLTIVPNRFQRARDGFFMDWEMVEIDFLRPFLQIPLAKTGDAEKRMILAEYGLRVKQEAGLGLAADIS